MNRDEISAMVSMRRPLWPRRALVLTGLAALAGINLLFGLGRIGLLGPDEPRYAAIARAMWRSGNWITPRLAGRVWLQKPVLYYWLGALSFHLFHPSTAAARLPNAVLAVLMAGALAWFIGRRVCFRAGALAAALGVSSAFVIGFGRAASTDMPLAAAMTFSLLCLYQGLHAPSPDEPRPWRARPGQGWLIAAGIFLGFAVLAKGPVAIVLEAPVFLLYMTAQRRWEWWRRILNPWPWLAFFLTAAPWYCALEWRHRGFFYSFFWRQNLERFATNRYHHPQPGWFYLPILLGAIFPWSGWLLLPLDEAGRGLPAAWRRWRDAQAMTASPEAGLMLFFGFWLIAPVAFFSLSSSKLPSYILPAIPGCLGLLALCGERAWRNKFPRPPLLITAACAALLFPVLGLMPWFLSVPALRPPWFHLLLLPRVWLGGLIFIVLAQWAWRRRVILTCALTLAITAAFVAGILQHWHQQFDLRASARPLARRLDDAFRQPYRAQLEGRGSLPAHAPVYEWHLNRDWVYGLEFYRRQVPRPLPPFSRLPPRGWLLTDRNQVAALRRKARAHGYELAPVQAVPAGAPWRWLEFAKTSAAQSK